jgi:hypothetical protein
MKKKVGITDSGIATAEIRVARQSRRNQKTTTTARIAPSTKRSIDALYDSLVNSTVELNSLVSIVGCSAADPLDRLLDRAGDVDRRRADAAETWKRDDALVVDEGVLRRIGGAVDRPRRGRRGRSSGRRAARSGARAVVDAGRAAERADALLVAADLRLAARHVDVDVAELAADLGGGDAVRGEPLGRGRRAPRGRRRRCA